jgi:tyrosyl-tRNA synthetase
MNAKGALAGQIVADFHSSSAAEQAEAHFRQVFQQREDPDEMADYRVVGEEDGMLLADVIFNIGFAPSKGQARRLIKQGGVSIDGEKITDPAQTVSPGEFVLKVGKRKFGRIQLVKGQS